LVTGTKRSEHVRIKDLLEKARIPSYNALTIMALAMETWKAHGSEDGPGGGRNPPGELMFGVGNELGGLQSMGGGKV
jgi:hypothetical protein